MKPYILNYSETIKVHEEPVIFDNRKQMSVTTAYPDATVETSTIETSDRDQIYLSLDENQFSLKNTYDCVGVTTKLTETVEPSDEDHLLYHDSTVVTKTIEPSDDF
jgi:hypothetical protein